MSEKITLAQIKATVLSFPEDTVWNLNSVDACPAAVAGQRLFNSTFSMFGFFTGFYDSLNIKHTRGCSWAECLHNRVRFIQVRTPKCWAEFSSETPSIISGKSLVNQLDQMLELEEDDNDY